MSKGRVVFIFVVGAILLPICLIGMSAAAVTFDGQDQLVDGNYTSVCQPSTPDSRIYNCTKSQVNI